MRRQVSEDPCLIPSLTKRWVSNHFGAGIEATETQKATIEADEQPLGLVAAAETYVEAV